ncbi:MAG: ferritin-like domain-containing protein, partial [Gammaproteobacteria bacterium]
MTGIFSTIKEALDQSDLALKCQATFALGELRELDYSDRSEIIEGIGEPGRPARPVLVDPIDVPRRRLGSVEGRVALIHAIAHIEFNAINLALDAAYRFRDMPPEYTEDWLSVAADEARHFGMLSGRLSELGYSYGDFPAHDGLWTMARQTAGSCLARMALVPRVLE